MSNKYWMGLNNPSKTNNEIDIGILGIPYDNAVSRKSGTSDAPGVIRTISKDLSVITENGTNLDGLTVKDFGDLEINSAADPEEAHYRILDVITKEYRNIPILLSIGGDHSITCGILESLCVSQNVGVIWIDSHPDLMNSFFGISYSGESEFSHACSLRRIVELPCVDPSDLLLIGIRNTFPEELEFIRDHNLDVIYSREIGAIHPLELSKYVIDKFSNYNEVYLSFDIELNNR